MNIAIVMAMNIYITPTNEELLRQEDSMSGLINQLLQEHYGSSPRTVAAATANKPEPEETPSLEEGEDQYEHLVLDLATNKIYDTALQEEIDYATPELAKELKKRGQVKN